MALSLNHLVERKEIKKQTIQNIADKLEQDIIDLESIDKDKLVEMRAERSYESVETKLIKIAFKLYIELQI